MAAAADVDTKELELCIKGLLISRPTVAKAALLQRECEEELGKAFPFRQLGFSTFVDYLRSIPSVVQLRPHDGYNPDVYPIASRASSHIDQLVSKQRVPPSKRRGVARQGFFSNRSSTAPVRRRRVVSRPTIPPGNRSNQVDYQTARSLKGIDVRDLERDLRRDYDERDLTRNGINNVDNLLSHAESMVEWRDTKVYPKLADGSTSMDQMFGANGIPSELDAEWDDSDQDFEFGDAEDSEEEMSKEAIKLWSKALGNKENNGSSTGTSGAGASVVCNSSKEDCKQNVDEPEEDSNISKGMINNFRKILSKYPEGIWASRLQELYYKEFRVPLNFLDLGYTSAISLATSLPSVFTFQRTESHDSKLYDARYHTLESLGGDENKDINSISENARFMPRMIIENIKKLLEENPNGFRSSDFLQLYEETYRKPLDLRLLGFNTLEEFLLILKNDITLMKTTSGYLLLPKHRIVPYEALEPPKQDERLNIPAEAFCIPIPENVVRLGEEIPHQTLPPVQNDPDKPLLELDVMVAEVMSPLFFYISLYSKYEELETMMDNLDKYYKWEEEKYLIPLPHFTVNLYCAAKYGGYWHRAKITRIKSDGNVEIEYIDYGTPGTVKSKELRYLYKDFAIMPTQAICAKLVGLKPLNDDTKFSKEVCHTFLNMVRGKRLVAHVYEVTSKVRHNQGKLQLNLLLYDLTNRNSEIIINDYLIENGLASPIKQTEETTSEDQFLEEPMVESALIPLQAIDPTPSLSLSGFPSLQEGGASSTRESDLASLHGNSLTSLPGNRTSLPASLRTEEEKKSRRPPPGFKEILPEPSFELSTPLPQSNLNYSQTQTSTYKSEQEPNIYVNNYYLMNSTEMYPELLMQEQCLPHTVCQPNPSNMPFTGVPLVQMPQQNRSRHSLTYGSFIPPQNAYKPHPNIYREHEYRNSLPIVSANYFPMTAPVPAPLSMEVPVPNNFILVNRPVPSNVVVMNTPVPSPYYSVYPTPPSHVVGNFSSNSMGQGYRGDFQMNPPPVQAVHTPPTYNHTSYTHKPSNTPTRVHTPIAPTTPSPAASPAPAFTPITIPEWPLKNLQVSYTSTTTETTSVSSRRSVPASAIKSELPEVAKLSRPNTPLTPASAEVAKISRPNTPLTPASAEVANICKSSRPNSSASNNSISNLKNITNSNDNSQININHTENSTNNPQINISLSDIDHFQSDKSEDGKFRSNSGLLMRDKIGNQLDVEVSEITLPAEINVKEIPLPPPTPEKLFSAISSPVVTVGSCGSDDYMSASENLELILPEFSKLYDESNKDIPDTSGNVELFLPELSKAYSESNKDIPDTSGNVELFLPELSKPYNESIKDIADSLKNVENSVSEVLKPIDVSNEDIPDSWENLDLDDTPAKAEDFAVDFSQPFEKIIKNFESGVTVNNNVPEVQKSAESLVVDEIPSLKIQAPVNWKDIFNPDISCLERFDNNNQVKEKCPSQVKFNIKKIPVQKLESQGKFFHLLNVNNKPAVITSEFFKQFITGVLPTVAEKVIEVYHNKFYYISKADHPSILDELNKVNEFCGNMPKKTVIRLNKVTVIDLSEIPQCLRIFNILNQPLLDDLQKISDEFNLC